MRLLALHSNNWMPQPLKKSGKVGTTRQDVRFNWQGGAACSRSIGAAPPGMMAAHPPSLCFSATRQHGPTVWNRCRLLSGNGISCVCLRIGWFQFVAAPNYSPDQVVKLCETRPAPGPAFLAWPGLFPDKNVPG